MHSHAELSAHPSFRQGAIPTGNVPQTIAAIFPDLDNLPDDEKVEQLIKRKAWLRFPKEGMPELVQKALNTFNERMGNTMEAVRERARTALTGVQIREQREREKTKPKLAAKPTENKVATTTGGKEPETLGVKGSDPLDDVKPYREEGEGNEVVTTEPVSEPAVTTPTPEVASPPQVIPMDDPPVASAEGPTKSFVAEVQTTTHVEDKVTSSTEEVVASGMPKRSVYTPPEAHGPPEGTRPAPRPAPPQFSGRGALGAKTVALILGLYFGLQASALLATRSLNFAVFMGILLILLNEKLGAVYAGKGKTAKLVKPFSILFFTTGLTLLTSAILLNATMVELEPNWAKSLIDAVIW